MGVYLPKMEMPTKGYRLILVHVDGTAQTTDGETTAISVPPHGRLIDADALIRDWPTGFVKTADVINNTPTIIPASEDGER